MVRCRLYHRDREALTERHVQALWYDRAMRPPNLVTRHGSSVRVIDPGVWNLGAGPDFRGAVLEVGRERRRLVGDVEIHLSPGDWTAHGHGTDPLYSRVVVHVTWGCGPDPADLPPCAVSIWLGRFFSGDVGFSPEQVDLTAYPFARLPIEERPCSQAIGADAELADAVLADAGAHRLRMKSERLASRLAACPRGQVFYEEFMTALGYRKNARGFRAVAEAVPLGTLRLEPTCAPAALVAAAEFVDWDLSGVRPRNHPATRLAAAGALFVRDDIIALVEAMDYSAEACRRMIRTITAQGLVGRGRAGAVLANVLVPLALAEGRLADVPDWLPPEDVSWPVRLTAFRLFGRDCWPAARYASNGLLIQGLLQIHRDFCLQVHPDCGRCGLVGEVSGMRNFNHHQQGEANERTETEHWR